MDGRSHCRSQVGRTEGEEAKAFISFKLQVDLHLLDARNQPFVDFRQIAALLHRYNANVILFVDPHQEGLFVVVEDTATAGPIAIAARVTKHRIVVSKEEVVFDQLVLHRLLHAFKGVVGPRVVLVHLLQSGSNLVGELYALLLGDGGRKGVAVDGAADANARRNDEVSFGIEVAERQAIDVAEVELGVLNFGRFHFVVIPDDGVEEVLEDGVALGIGAARQ